MIGIIGAMAVEVDAIKASLEKCEIKKVSGIEFCRGYLDGKETVVAQCGIGKVFAALCAEAMINTYSPECIINTGVAGCLSEKLGTTDIAISKSVVHHDMDTSHIGDPVGLVSGINLVEIPADKALADELAAIVEKNGINYVKGIIASGDQFVCTQERKDFIKNTFGAVACEMEGAAIGQVCYVNEVPFVILRAISDNADGTSDVDFPTFAAEAAKNSIKIVTEFVRTH